MSDNSDQNPIINVTLQDYALLLSYAKIGAAEAGHNIYPSLRYTERRNPVLKQLRDREVEQSMMHHRVQRAAVKKIIRKGGPEFVYVMAPTQQMRYGGINYGATAHLYRAKVRGQSSQGKLMIAVERFIRHDNENTDTFKREVCHVHIDRVFETVPEEYAFYYPESERYAKTDEAAELTVKMKQQPRRRSLAGLVDVRDYSLRAELQRD